MNAIVIDLGQIFVKKTDRIISIVTVSYTHLDVYKRQAPKAGGLLEPEHDVHVLHSLA